MSGARRVGESLGGILRQWRVAAAGSGAMALIWGVDQWSRPAAACVAGVVCLALALAPRKGGS